MSLNPINLTKMNLNQNLCIGAPELRTAATSKMDSPCN